MCCELASYCCIWLFVHLVLRNCILFHVVSVDKSTYFFHFHSKILFCFQQYDKCFLGSAESGDDTRVFCGQMAASYVFSEAVNAAQVYAMYQLGPAYKVNLC